MTLIVITRPDFYPAEAEQIELLLRQGLDVLHLRKPEASPQEVAALLDKVPADLHSHIVLHEHFELSKRYAVRGLHLNRRHPQIPVGFLGQVSRSCHSFEEVMLWKPACDYLFLSPIYDSISKQGYASAFSPQQLAEASRQGIIDRKVIALGGITPRHFPELKAWGFGGAALLGDVWNQPQELFLSHFIKIKKEAE